MAGSTEEALDTKEDALDAVKVFLGTLGYLSWCSFERAQRDDENDVFNIAVECVVLLIHVAREHGPLHGVIALL